MAFVIWEAKFAKFPMFPARLKQSPRILALTLVITFISGANFFSVLLFWPTQAFNVYGHDPVGVGIRGLPIGFSILGGAVIVLWLLSLLRGHNRELMIVSSIIMTAGTLLFHSYIMFTRLIMTPQASVPLHLSKQTPSTAPGACSCSAV